ncbi:nitrite reductase large subunit NirB [Paeniglutamicibacter terrestris]|uniref:assimilatory sulfite reductase (ferredoxin) n=1 Tax=Paeniglutamicibacter terrestris TaxID=2723403 RepID=A0ABX1G048_9MICC|nr:nitrite reductase large subunit NirB [Paeniglutamicibacter terrestris]ASN38352.1 nitrite reductase (NAD(P)H) [Arthrobacter sp. 7749]NKG19414.1 FAD-dependent oxidoreductase [Paeniglutamicibacter terrestris]
MGTGNGIRRIVVIGGGPAAHRFTEAMAKREPSNLDITVLTEEAHVPYDRVALTKALTNTSVDLTLGDPGLWAQENVTLVTNAGVKTLDSINQLVITHDGRSFAYDELVLATGSNAATLPIPGNEHTHVYRTLEDVWAINAGIQHLAAQLGRKPVVATIGGGLLGLEAAAGSQSLGAEAVVIDGGKWLMGTQLDEGAGQAMGRLIAQTGFKVHGGVFPKEVTTESVDGVCRVTGVLMADENHIPADMVIVSIGVRPRDELARNYNQMIQDTGAHAPVFGIGPRGGIEIDEHCATAVPHIWAIGEVANFAGMCIGLVAPANAMAEVLAAHLQGGEAAFTGFDTATKLKLSGVDVASFGDGFARTEGSLEVVYADAARGLYQKIVVSSDAKVLLGGIFVGDASPYQALRPLLGRELPAEAGAYLSALGGEVPDGDLPDDAVLCSCNSVSVGAIKDAVGGCGSCEGSEPVNDLATLKTCTRAGTQCGSCVPMLKKLMESQMTKNGVVVSTAMCEHFELSRSELFEAVQVAGLHSYPAIMERFGKGSGCDICKPVIASVLASQTSGHPMEAGLAGAQDTNDRVMANMQKDGTYSVVPRIPGGEITPQKLGVIAAVAEKYNLYTKLTGGLRIDMFGARLEQLPEIWKELVDAGFESGQAYGKSLRNVKTCVGSSWCRYGMLDSVAMGIEMELRYRGLRAPHKFKMGVSGCARECAEARAKDVGVIATAEGWNLYVGGNGGANPAHAQLLIGGLDDATLLRYIDRYLMYYIRTADKLQRTARWMEDLEGGIEHVKSVVVDDSLGLGAELEAAMENHVGNYQDEWAATLADPEKLRRFRSFVNAPDQKDEDLTYIAERGQHRPVEPVSLGSTISIGAPATGSVAS